MSSHRSGVAFPPPTLPAPSVNPGQSIPVVDLGPTSELRLDHATFNTIAGVSPAELALVLPTADHTRVHGRPQPDCRYAPCPDGAVTVDRSSETYWRQVSA